MAIAHRIAALNAATLCAAALCAVAPAEAGPVVRAPAGAVQGVEANGERIFRGIPYALPPVGERRWKAPDALPAWSGVRDASAFGAACQQPAAPAGSIYAETYPAMSEDCLSLNIWAPAKAKNAPVFVWIHGGNLVRGSSQQAMFDGAALAKRGVVVVSINYRLGIFGYFAHPELSAESPRGVSGNYGLLDQIAALRWVNRNIAAFGGSKAKVTIAGESAGGLAILHLLAAPDARGLFARAIVQSASLMNIPELKQASHGLPSAESTGSGFAAMAGARTLADLRAIDGPRLTALAQGRFASTAIVDGKILPRQLIETFERGEQARVPLMTGFTAGEIRTMKSILPMLPDVSQFDPAKYEAAIRANYGELADAFLRLYPASDIDGGIFGAARDGFFGWTSQRLVREQARIGQPAYLYFFDHGTPAADQAGIHAFHASEVPYMFGTIGQVTALWPKFPDTAAERTLSDAMVDYWTSFARSGVPKAPGQPAWPSHNKRADYMIFAGTPRVATDLMPGQYRLHDQVVCRRRAMGNIPWNWNVGVASPALPPAVEACR
ncbi:carboxylesterase family protein [Sphingomonas sp. AOB5]|uniref:carboxylesterase/lipase family protein n=1 Tax=Sphingomonas sp. AOB5 TaxID=3034017 RepID=UPI0023FA470F|nr:carboxylesterase family protein [Sphingomonas sp. AOB5]MDF7775373.1 carboxylesterase family protein [Sphingomonas sp. AOB5]